MSTFVQVGKVQRRASEGESGRGKNCHLSFVSFEDAGASLQPTGVSGSCSATVVNAIRRNPRLNWKKALLLFVLEFELNVAFGQATRPFIRGRTGTD